MSHRANVLRAYRELIDLLKRLPPDRREAGLQEARAAVRANASERDALKASDMLKDLVARVSFLRMATPKHARDRRSSHGAVTYVLRDGELVEGQGRTEGRVADGSMSVDEAYSRHKQLLKRQHFGREPPNVRKIF